MRWNNLWRPYIVANTKTGDYESGVIFYLRGFMSTLIMQAQGGSLFIDFILPMLLIFVLFWFLLIRPQTKRMKEHQAMLAAIQRGDKVMTNGGILGKVTKVTDEELTVEIAQGTKVQIRKGMIADVINRTQPANDTGKKK